MPQEHEPILRSSLRAFMRALFTVFGITAAIVLLLLFFVSTKERPPQKYTVRILANAEGKRAILPDSGPVLLQVNLHGAIGLGHLTTDAMTELLVESREGDLEHDRVKGVLLTVNSPGGTITDASGIYHALQEYKTRYQVPIVAYVEGLSASGAVLICCAADKVVATDSSLVGSVGVITPPFFNVSSFLEKMGIASLTVFAGKEKDELNPFRPWTKTESEPVQEIIHYYYEHFLDTVTRHRPLLSREKLTKEYGARVFPASIAQQYGYIDASGYNRSDAIKLLLAQAKIENSDYRIVELSDKGWITELFEARSTLFTGMMEHLFGVKKNDFEGQLLYMYRP